MEFLLMPAQFRVNTLLTFFVVLLACALGCDSGAPSPQDAGSSTDAAEDVQPDAADGESCTPLTCAEVPSSCGVVDDGCGGELDCGACSCSDSTFEQDCPSRPCMETVGCSQDGECEYAPVSCGGASCEACADGSCSESELRTCSSSDSCPAAFCDPAPTTTDGVTTYANTCTTEAVVRCGVCGLGAYTCGDDGSFACNEPALPGAGDLRPNCESADRPTFVYLDPTYAGDDRDGTRDKPYTTFEAAFDRIRSVDAKALVIGGSPELTVPQEASGRAEAPYYGFRVPEGISILGGYGTSPDFTPDASQRPTIYAPDANIALEAVDIDTPTVLTGLTFENSRDAISETSYGAVIRRSPDLEMVDVTIVANEAPRSGESVGVADPAAQVVWELLRPASWLKDFHAFEHIYTDVSIPVSAGAPQSWDAWQNDDWRCGFDDPASEQVYGFASYSIPVHHIEGGSGGRQHNGYNHCCGTEGGDGSAPLGTTDRAYAPSDAVGGDGPSYSGARRFAPTGESGQGGGELDGDRLWRELGDGTYGDIGVVGRSGAGGSSGAPEFFENISTDPNPDSSNSYVQSFSSVFVFGAQGGHGGFGGCGGVGGRAGRGGKWTIGILLDASGDTTFNDVKLDVGAAGPGERGSAGGTPTEGTDGLPGTTFEFEYTPDGSSQTQTYDASGYDGGDGAEGQWGGHGGHGAGGSVVGVLCADSSFEDSSGLDMQLGEAGGGATGTDSAAPQGMPAPADAPAGEVHATYQCDPTPVE